MNPCEGLVFNKVPIADYTYFITDFAKVTPYNVWTLSIPSCGPLAYAITYEDGITTLSPP